MGQWGNDTVKLPTLKNPLFGARFSANLFRKPSYSHFMLKILNFRYHGNKEKFKDTIKLDDPVNNTLVVEFTDLLSLKN